MNQSSTAAWLYSGFYGLAKVAMNGLTQQLAHELGWSKIRPAVTAGSNHLQFAGPADLRLTTDLPLSYLDGRAFALKMAGGSDGARQATTGEALRVLGVDVDGALGETRDATRPIVSGHGREVGRIDALAWTPRESER